MLIPDSAYLYSPPFEMQHLDLVRILSFSLSFMRVHYYPPTSITISSIFTVLIVGIAKPTQSVRISAMSENEMTSEPLSLSMVFIAQELNVRRAVDTDLCERGIWTAVQIALLLTFAWKLPAEYSG